MTPAVLRFPLRGEWCATNTPAKRVPSHGTDYFAQTYAYDFLRIVDDRFHRNTLLRELWGRVPASDYLAWNEPVHSACDGEVIAAADGAHDRGPINALVEMVLGDSVTPMAVRDDYRPLTGNYVIVRGDAGVALYAHLRQGSVNVRAGQTIREGDVVGAVGNSGNSAAPHLHVQLMDGPDPLTAKGLPLAFRGYERFSDGNWIAVESGMPASFERIRSA